MRPALRVRGALGVLAVLTASLVGAIAGGGAGAVPAQRPNRAVVVVDSGAGTVVEGIEFTSESISGLEALQMAGMSPVVWASPGEGGAVCALRGVGCAADNRCLTCQAPNYWVYHRAPAGSGGYSYSQVGAGATRVRDGDVEGWRWGTGAAPADHSVDSVFGAPPPPPPPAAPGGAPSGGGSAASGTSSGGGGPGAPGASGDAEGQDGSTTTTDGGSTTTSRPEADGRDGSTSSSDTDTGDDTDDDLDAAPASTRRPGDDSGRNWLASAVLFACVLGVVLVLLLRARRQRAA